MSCSMKKHAHRNGYWSCTRHRVDFRGPDNGVTECPWAQYDRLLNALAKVTAERDEARERAERNRDERLRAYNELRWTVADWNVLPWEREDDQ